MSPPSKSEALSLTAARLFLSEGFHVGIDKIVLQSGAAKMTLYKYFPNKSQLIRAVLQQAYDQLIQATNEYERRERSRRAPGASSVIDIIWKAMLAQPYPPALLFRAVVELEGNDDSVLYQFAVKLQSAVSDVIDRLCSRLGDHDEGTARNIHLHIAGAFALRAIYGESKADSE